MNTLSEPQLADLFRLYEREWWTQGRSLEEIREMIANSSVIVGLVDEHDRLLAFCRVLTDFVFRGTLFDVIVDPQRRGEGLGRELMEAVTDHPRLTRVSAMTLACKPDMPEFYELFGFRPYEEELVWMVRKQRAG